MLSKNNKE